MKKQKKPALEYDSDGSMPQVNPEEVKAEVPKKERKDMSKPPMMADTSNVSSNLEEVFPSRKQIDVDESEVVDANNILKAISRKNSKEIVTPAAGAAGAVEAQSDAGAKLN
jgi:hypothetical protein